jgi:DNA-binding transcriptional MerR regulator
MKSKINEIDNKVQYSIKDVEKLTGVKAHTLRIWEQRYGFLIPHRTDTNIRYYDDEQLKSLLNISLLLRNGKKISKVAEMTHEQIGSEVIFLSSQNKVDRNLFHEMQIDSLIVAMIDLDEHKFDKILNDCINRYSFEDTMLHVLIPFLSKVGVLWSVGEINVAQEHFITNLIRRKLIVKIDNCKIPTREDSKFLLYLPEGELHELGLLFAKFLIKSHNHKVIYLGQSLPYEDLKLLSKKYQPHYLLTYFTSEFSSGKLQEYINHLGADFPDKKIIICGPLLTHKPEIKLPENVLNFAKIEQLIEILKAN